MLRAIEDFIVPGVPARRTTCPLRLPPPILLSNPSTYVCIRSDWFSPVDSIGVPPLSGVCQSLTGLFKSICALLSNSIMTPDADFARGGAPYWHVAFNTLIRTPDELPPVTNYKIVHDSVHGSIRMQGVFLKLLEAPELQRLHSIHQLGLAYLVYPGANHTRFEHSLGTFSVAKRLCEGLGLSTEEASVVQCAALLHDVGHLPYSQTLEFVLPDQLG